jgi:dephospho-CoA kinase
VSARGYGVLVAVVFVTGMTGTGKSSALNELARRGHRVVDTDYGGWSEHVPCSEWPGWEQLWREDRIDALLRDHHDGTLFISGTVANQGTFYPRFDAVVLLSASPDLILERVAARDTNNYGKTPAQRDEILHHIATVEPLLRVRATTEIDTSVPLAEVVDLLERIAANATADGEPRAVGR